jgi:hypothetical protein
MIGRDELVAGSMLLSMCAVSQAHRQRRAAAGTAPAGASALPSRLAITRRRGPARLPIGVEEGAAA